MIVVMDKFRIQVGILGFMVSMIFIGFVIVDIFAHITSLTSGVRAVLVCGGFVIAIASFVLAFKSAKKAAGNSTDEASTFAIIFNAFLEALGVIS